MDRYDERRAHPSYEIHRLPQGAPRSVERHRQDIDGTRLRVESIAGVVERGMPSTPMLPLRALLRWPCGVSPLGNVNNRLLSLQIATKTFDPLPLVCMIKALQSSELRKHSLVRLNDLLLT